MHTISIFAFKYDGYVPFFSTILEVYTVWKDINAHFLGKKLD